MRVTVALKANHRLIKSGLPSRPREPGSHLAAQRGPSRVTLGPNLFFLFSVLLILINVLILVKYITNYWCMIKL
jgi:hypothetical protein